MLEHALGVLGNLRLVGKLIDFLLNYRNYAPGIKPQATAAEKGHQQVLWMFLNGNRLRLTEVGTMNLFVFWKNVSGVFELVTPELDGTILPGVTRDSIIKIVQDESFSTIFPCYGNIKVTEKALYMSEIVEANEDNRLLEMFGSGTAAIVSPIKGIAWIDPLTNVEIFTTIPLDQKDSTKEAGPLSRAIFDRIQNIQYGQVPFNDWSEVICDSSNQQPIPFVTS